MAASDLQQNGHPANSICNASSLPTQALTRGESESRDNAMLSEDFSLVYKKFAKRIIRLGLSLSFTVQYLTRFSVYESRSQSVILTIV